MVVEIKNPIPRWFEGRLQVLFMIYLVAFAILGAALFTTQIIRGNDYRQLSMNNRIRRILVEAPRGRILDRNGAILADSRPRFDLSIVREELPKEKKAYVEDLSRFLGMEQMAVWKVLQSRAQVPYLPAVLARDVDIATVTRVEEQGEELPALQIQVQPTRFYPHGEICAHWIGTVGKIPEEEAQFWKEKGVSLQETIGRSGVEKACDLHLRGISGGMQVQVNNRGTLDKVMGARDPIPGKDLELTLDLRLQKALYNAFADRSGAGLVLDPRTGEVLALVSRPSYDPNLLVSGTQPEKIKALLEDPHRPLFARPTQGLYPPGSLFKIVVALAALQNQPPSFQNRRVFCDGKFELGDATFGCWKEGGHGSVDLLDAIQHSCNVYFYTVGLEVGPEKIAPLAAQFGLGKNTGFFLGDSKGLIPTPQWKKDELRQSWYGGDTANFAIGQGAMAVTPLQMACFLGAVATDGVWRAPVILKGAPSKTIDLTAYAPSLRLVKEGMRRVVQESDGTGRRAFVPELPAAGKTGTVEISRGNGKKVKHAWFGGFAPFENPEIVVVILVEEGESGGSTSAPIAKKVFEAYTVINKVKS